MFYTLSEYSWLSGCGHTVGSAGSADLLPWEEIDDLNTYEVKRGSVVIAEFGGHAGDMVRSWLFNHPDYDGRNGCKAWKGECDCCGRTFVADHCDCDEAVERYNHATAIEAADHALRARLTAVTDCDDDDDDDDYND